MNDDTPSLADIRVAAQADADSILRMMELFNTFEEIAFTREKLARSYEMLMAHPEWGVIFIAEVGGVPAGYAMLAFGFDFEFAGRDGFMTELWVNDRQRNQGVAKALMAHLEGFARSQEINALHLIVRRENSSAQILYRRDGYTFDPRLLMTKTLV